MRNGESDPVWDRTPLIPIPLEGIVATDTSSPTGRHISHRMSVGCSVAALLLSFILVPMGMCSHGDFSLEFLPVVGAVAGIAWFGFFASSENDLPSVAVRVVALILANWWLLRAIVTPWWGFHG